MLIFVFSYTSIVLNLRLKGKGVAKTKYENKAMGTL